MEGLLLTAQPAFLSLLCASVSVLGAWHFRRCYRRERVYFHGWFDRASDPLNYWLAISWLGVATVTFAFLAVQSAFDALGL